MLSFSIDLTGSYFKSKYDWLKDSFWIIFQFQLVYGYFQFFWWIISKFIETKKTFPSTLIAFWFLNIEQFKKWTLYSVVKAPKTSKLKKMTESLKNLLVNIYAVGSKEWSNHKFNRRKNTNLYTLLKNCLRQYSVFFYKLLKE